MPAKAPLHVLHLVPQLRVGGMEQGVVKLLNGLPDDRIVSSVCCFERDTDAIADLIRPGVAVRPLGRRRGNDPYLVWRLMRLMRAIRPDIVHSHSWGTLCEGYVAAKAARVSRFVHGEHGTMETRPRNLRVQRWLWTRADRVLAVSSRLADRMALLTGFPRERVHVIRNGADLKRFDRVDRVDARASLEIDPTAFVIGTVGRLVAVKDHETLFAALLCLKQRGIAAATLVAGDGPLGRQLVDRASALGLDSLIRWLGARPDVERVLAALDVFVLTSESEGLPNTVLEAMAAGLPVVATHVGGVDELVDNGRTGFLAPAKDAPAIAAALIRLAGDAALRLEMGNSGRLKATAEFGLARMLDDYVRFYTSLMDTDAACHQGGPNRARSRRCAGLPAE